MRNPVKLSTPSERSDAGCLYDYLTGQHPSRKTNGGENNITSRKWERCNISNCPQAYSANFFLFLDGFCFFLRSCSGWSGSYSNCFEGCSLFAGRCLNASILLRISSSDTLGLMFTLMLAGTALAVFLVSYAVKYLKIKGVAERGGFILVSNHE